MLTHSIRWRLNLWLGFLLVCMLSGFGFTVYQLQRINQLSQLDEELQKRVAALSSAVRGGPPREFGPGGRPFERGPRLPDVEEGPGRPPPSRERSDFSSTIGPPWRPRDRFGPPPRGGPPEMRLGPREITLSPEVASLFDQARTNGFYFAIWGRGGTMLKRSTNAPADVSLPEPSDNDTRIHTRMHRSFREAFHFTEMGDCVLAGRSILADLDARHRFAMALLAAGGTVLALGFGVGWWLTTRAIQPVEEISAAASRISAGTLSERVAVDDPESELGRLAGVLNSTFARLEAAFGRQKQFTADAAHELRTPLAVIISEAQTTLARERSGAEYRDAVEACLETAQQMRRLTESLLELARSDSAEERIQRSKIDLAESARAGVENIRPLAEKCGIQIHCDLAPAEIFSNGDRLAQVITNLLSNALNYNKPDGEIRVSTRRENDASRLTIIDTGAGIGEQDLPHIFERFYRADKSRSRAEGHSGLGLAICKAIVEADGGSVEVCSQPGAGSTFTVRWPTQTR